MCHVRRPLLPLLILALPLIAHEPVGAQDTPTPVSSAATPVASATGVTVEWLATVILPAEALPRPPAVFDAWTVSHFPESGMTWPAETLVSVAADVVLAGEYAVESAGRLQVQRGGQIEEVAPNTEVALTAGDAAIYVENAAAQTVRGLEDDLTRVVSFGVFPVEAPLTTAIAPIDSEEWEASGLADRDLSVTVERVTLEPGVRLPEFAPSLSAPRLFIVEDGSVAATIVSDGATIDETTYYPGLAIWFEVLAPGQSLTVVNTEDEPAALLQLSLAPAAAAATATPTS